LRPRALRLTLLGVGAMNSPRFAPAGLLVEHGRSRVVIDGGPGAAPPGSLDAWLVCDERAELRRELKALAGSHGLEPRVAAFASDGLRIEPHPVVHTSHPTFGYRIQAEAGTAAWVPEFLEFPAWAAGLDLLLAEAAGWDRPIRFAGGVGGHASTRQVSAAARAHRVRRLVFAHIGRPTIRAIDAGLKPPFGSFGRDGQRLVLRPKLPPAGPVRPSGS
jgi:hypothetical protein